MNRINNNILNMFISVYYNLIKKNKVLKIIIDYIYLDKK